MEPMAELNQQFEKEPSLPVGCPKGKKNLTDAERRAVFEYLLRDSNGWKLKKGSISSASDLFSVSTNTISKIWHQGKNSCQDGSPADVSARKKGRVGRKKINMDLNAVQEVPLRLRTTIRTLANSLKIPKSTLHDRFKDGDLRR